MTQPWNKHRKAQFFIITTVLISAALMFITSMFMSTSNIDYTNVLSRHDTALVQNTAEQVRNTWWDQKWQYRNSVTVQELNGTYVTNQSVPVTLPIPTTHINPDCSDIRVVTNTGTVPWIPTTACTVERYEDRSTALVRLKMDEGTGQWANDSTGHQHNAVFGTDTTTEPTDPTWTTGKYDYGVAFDGINDYLHIPDTPALDLPQNFTISLWFKPRQAIDTRNNQQGLVSKRDSYGLWWESSDDGRLRFGTFGGRIKSTKDTWAAHTWYHVTAVHNGSTSKIYVNGKLDAQATNTDPVTASPYDLLIGKNEYQDASQGPARYFNGTIDDVRIYNRSLTAGEIAGIYRNGVGINMSLSLSPGDRKTVYVYHGNKFATNPSYSPLLLQQHGLKHPPRVISVGSERSHSEEQKNVVSAVNRLDAKISSSITLDTTGACPTLTFRSPLTTLLNHIC